MAVERLSLRKRREGWATLKHKGGVIFGEMAREMGNIMAVRGMGGDEKAKAKDEEDGHGDRGGCGSGGGIGACGGDGEREEQRESTAAGFRVEGGDGVVILQDVKESMDDPMANRRAQKEVEKALMKWGRFRLTQEAFTADLVMGVSKGTGKVASPTIGGGPVDSRPGTIETTDNQIRVGVQQGRLPDGTQTGDASGPTGKASPGMKAGSIAEDRFEVFQGREQYSVSNAPVWKYMGKNGLKPPDVTAVAEFRKAVEEAEKAAAQKKQLQQQQSQQGQKKNP